MDRSWLERPTGTSSSSKVTKVRDKKGQQSSWWEESAGNKKSHFILKTWSESCIEKGFILCNAQYLFSYLALTKMFLNKLGFLCTFIKTRHEGVDKQQTKNNWEVGTHHRQQPWSQGHPGSYQSVPGLPPRLSGIIDKTSLTLSQRLYTHSFCVLKLKRMAVWKTK